MKTVLVVEDDLSILRLLSSVLEDEGYCVLTATDGLVAWACVRDAKPDLVLSNIQLPKFDGRDLARAINTDPDLSRIPVVLMSAGSEPGPTGFFTAFVHKPFSLDELLTLVAQQLGNPRPEHQG